MKLTPPLILAALFAAAPAQAELFKCTVGGRTVYQDQPCPQGAGKPLALRVEKIDPTEANQRNERIRADLAEGQKNRAIEDVRSRIAQQERLRRALLADMEAETSALRAKQALAKNNLAGAVWLQSLASEQQAVAQRYRSQIDTVDSTIQGLRAEEARLLQSR